MGYWLEKGIIYYGDKWGNLGHEFLGKYFFAHELHEWTRRLCDTRMATGSVALIYTNAMRGRYDDNRDNLRQLEVVFCGRNRNASKYYCPRIIGNIFFAHELHELTRIVAMD